VPETVLVAREGPPIIQVTGHAQPDRRGSLEADYGARRQGPTQSHTVVQGGHWMPRKHPISSRNFTAREANATLPLVRAIVSDLTELSRDVIQRRERMAGLPSVRACSAPDPYREEMVQIKEELDRDIRRLREYVEELLALGVQPRSVTRGLVDFPAMIDGRPAYLCWKLGEPEVLHWHERDAPFHDRQPLAAASVAEAGGPPGDTGSPLC